MIGPWKRATTQQTKGSRPGIAFPPSVAGRQLSVANRKSKHPKSNHACKSIYGQRWGLIDLEEQNTRGAGLRFARPCPRVEPEGQRDEGHHWAVRREQVDSGGEGDRKSTRLNSSHR